MTDLKDVLIGEHGLLREAIQRIDANPLHIALVVDRGGKLLGTVTDGDVRRAMLRGCTLDSSIRQVMNPQPTVASRNEPREGILALMRQRQLRQIPVVGEDGRVLRVELLDDMVRSEPKDNAVVVMAGGLGSRLQPLTEACPKPMLKVGGKPILQTILESFIDHGLNRFYFSVNYRADMIKAHFGDGGNWGVAIRYLEEDQSLGTAGALSLLPEQPASALIVMNGDVLTKVNFEHLLDFHRAQAAAATVCVRDYEFQIPYGVVSLERQRIVRISEKPTHRSFVNAGIYVLEPRVLRHVQRHTRYDMTALLDALIAAGDPVAAFPLREYWIDIGRLDDYERAHGEYGGIFQ